VLGLAPVGPAVSTSSGAALEKPLEGGGFAALAEDLLQVQSVAAVLLQLAAEALPGAAVVTLQGEVALAVAELQAPCELAAAVGVEALQVPF